MIIELKLINHLRLMGHEYCISTSLSYSLQFTMNWFQKEGNVGWHVRKATVAREKAPPPSHWLTSTLTFIPKHLILALSLSTTKTLFTITYSLSNVTKKKINLPLITHRRRRSRESFLLLPFFVCLFVFSLQLIVCRSNQSQRFLQFLLFLSFPKFNSVYV